AFSSPSSDRMPCCGGLGFTFGSFSLEGSLVVNRRFSAMAFMLVLSLATFGMWGVNLLGADQKQTGAEIAKRQKVLAEQALKFITQLEQQGQIGLGLRDVPRWSRRLVEATRKSGAKKPEIIEAVKQHLARMDDRVERLTKMYNTGVATHSDV